MTFVVFCISHNLDACSNSSHTWESLSMASTLLIYLFRGRGILDCLRWDWDHRCGAESIFYKLLPSRVSLFLPGFPGIRFTIYHREWRDWAPLLRNAVDSATDKTGLVVLTCIWPQGTTIIDGCVTNDIIIFSAPPGPIEPFRRHGSFACYDHCWNWERCQALSSGRPVHALLLPMCMRASSMWFMKHAHRFRTQAELSRKLKRVEELSKVRC